MVARSKDLWSLVWGKPYIHPGDLAEAVTEQAVRPSLDFRTRLLIRDSIDALKEYWGLSRLTDWLFRCPSRASIESICHEELGEPGFSTIKERLVDDQGEVRRFVNVYVNEEDIRFLQNQQTPLKDGDEISIIPAIAGG